MRARQHALRPATLSRRKNSRAPIILRTFSLNCSWSGAFLLNMEEHRKYLADRLLSDEQPVSSCPAALRWLPDPSIDTSQITYRLLSRALDVHVNTAKEFVTLCSACRRTILTKTFTECSMTSSTIRTASRRTPSTLPTSSMDRRKLRPRSRTAMSKWGAHNLSKTPSQILSSQTP